MTSKVRLTVRWKSATIVLTLSRRALNVRGRSPFLLLSNSSARRSSISANVRQEEYTREEIEKRRGYLVDANALHTTDLLGDDVPTHSFRIFDGLKYPY